MSQKFSMDDYVDVAERIAAFKVAYPHGTLQTMDWGVTPIGDRNFVFYRAAAFRTPDDPRPAHGTAWEPFPGPTAYTKDSELMNAETAAWGRAIVALGIPAKKIASKQEVQARVGPELVDAAGIENLKHVGAGLTADEVKAAMVSVGIDPKGWGSVPKGKAALVAEALIEAKAAKGMTT